MDIANAPEAADSLYVQTSVKNQVNLVNHAGLTLRFWDGTGGENGELKNNGVINGGDGIWQSSQGNDNWTTDESTPEGALNAPFTDAAFAVFQGEAGNVTVDNSKGDVIISGAQFATDGYRGRRSHYHRHGKHPDSCRRWHSRRRQLHRHYRQRYPRYRRPE
jgi:fibronectin-binding autotransporter adhesin